MKLYHVDAFAQRPFSGNPAAVCLLDRSRDPEWMQALAQELNLSETAFLHDAADGIALRWFTPTIEVELCGHATLASAHVLWDTGRAPRDEKILFHTRSGDLAATLTDEWIELDFPATPESASECNVGLDRALGTQPIYVGRSQFDFLVEVSSERVVRELEPDLELIRRVSARGVIVTARSTSAGIDFVSRFFAPQSGVAEDPVTGSSHCCLAPYWGKLLGKREMVGYQASPRGGMVRVRLEGDRVVLGGQAVTVFEADLR